MRVRYTGPFGSLAVDGIEIPQGAAAEVTEDQYERIKHRGVEVVEESRPSGHNLRNLTERTTSAPEGGAAAEEV